MMAPIIVAIMAPILTAIVPTKLVPPSVINAQMVEIRHRALARQGVFDPLVLVF